MMDEMMNLFPEEMLKAFNMDIASMNSAFGWLKSEGFEHITNKTEDSYGFLERYPDERYNAFLRNNYWYWAKCFKYFIIRIYVFRNCVIVDKDWDCGGNAGGRVFEFELWSIDEIWDEIIQYIKTNIED